MSQLSESRDTLPQPLQPIATDAQSLQALNVEKRSNILQVIEIEIQRSQVREAKPEIGREGL